MGCVEYFVGLDLSISETGLVILDNETEIQWFLIKSKTDSIIEDRFDFILDKIKFVKGIVGLKSVYMENLSFASRGNAIFQLAGLHFIVRHFFFKNNVPYKLIAPQTLKKFVTGNGRSTKDIIIKEIYKKWNVDINNNNLADAYALARMAFEDSKK